MSGDRRVELYTRQVKVDEPKSEYVALAVRGSRTNVHGCIHATLTQSVDPNAVSVGGFNVGFQFGLEFDALSFRDIEFENAVLLPGPIPLERSVDASAV
jgi:hypothetical protein